ncbi:RHS repeat-associated core domain-containing protein [Spirosoma sordidisoli]|uniref:RHS repeat protein n=1 Tax=Spirosoma sordidisoli TaxID=2502893 RepID=A0A4Q2UJN0_9BACT|nr:RHS repeat-associated core domain-containing protein [Spirosoma sordidisoli]RYC66959.1 hypothetical protein EQG79_26655 [Spirosoma sordidisoli]
MIENYRLFLLSLLCFLSQPILAQNNTRPNVLVPNGFSVNSYTGNLHQARTDLKITGQGLPIKLAFSYNVSRRNRDWGFGKGWTFAYNIAYRSDSAGIWIERADGRRHLYRKSGSTYTAPTGVFDALVEYQPGKFYLQTKENERYYFDNTTHKRLTKVQDAKGNLLNLVYKDSLLNTLTDDAGHSIGFTWTNGRLTEIADNSCQPIRKVSYEYDNRGNPIKVTNPLGDFVRYYYDSTARVVGYTDAGGNNMSILYNLNNAVVQIASCGTTHLFTYVPTQRKTYVTEKISGRSVVTVYTFDVQGRIASKKGNCCGFNLDYTYDHQDNVSARRDGNNKQTKYEYNDRGNVLRETDPAGYFNTYAYDPVHNKPTRLQDKNGNVTTFQYDASGNLTQVNKPLSVTLAYTYDAKGNKLTETDGNGGVTAYEYNQNGYLVSMTDAEGGITRYTYDCRGNRLSMTNPRSFTTTYEYNAQDLLVKKTDALGQISTYAYDKLGNLIVERDALGRETTYAYDGLNRRISVILPLGNILRTAYDEQGNISTQTDANGNSTTYTYNDRKQPLTSTDALGNTISYTYDEAGNRLSETDKRGNTIRFSYDDQYRLIKRIDALGNSVAYSYDPAGNRVAELDANGQATTYQYDALQRLVKVTDPMSKSVEYTYDRNNNRLTVKAKNGNVTTYAYDKLNRISSITDALAGVTAFSYDATGNRLTEKDALNHTTSYTYDVRDQPLTIINALNEVTKFTYDAVGNVKTTTLPNGNVITNTFDANNRLVKIVDAVGTVMSYAYDNSGNRVSETNGINNTTAYQYDRLYRVDKITFPNATTFQFQFDANGNKVKEINQKGLTTTFEYDELNRISAIIDALGYPNRATYDERGNLATITDAKGNVTSYSYDARNQLVKQIYADGSTKAFAYDANQLLTSRTDSKGVLTQYRYDKLNRLTERVYPGNLSDRFTYDAVGRILSAVNANATVTYSYDALGRLTKEDLNGKASTYEHNTAAKTSKKNYPSGTQLVWQLDNRGRLTDIQESGSSLVSFQYDVANQQTGLRFRNGVTTAYRYDKMGNLTNMVTTPNTIANYTYRYDEADKRISTERLHQPTRSEQYSYDNLFQVNSFATGQYTNGSLTPSTTQQFTYDALGNRLSVKENALTKTYAVNNLNQYISINVNGVNAPPSYDRAGNLLKDETNTYSYDYENRLTGIQSSSGTVTYKYDALGRRVSRTVGGTETLYVYDQDNIVEQYTGSAVRSFMYGSALDQILVAKVGAATYFYHTDDLNSAQALTDATGALAEYYTYDPFGTPHIFNPANVEITTSAINTLLYKGREYDFLTKTYNYRFREMNPTLGRFTQRDPLEYLDGLNCYAYVNNNVINNTDPMGLVNWGGVGSSIGGMIGNGLGFAGSAAVAIGGAPTVAGAVAGGAGMAYFGYGFGANLANFKNALYDEEPVSTGGAAGDATRELFPCNEAAQAAGQLADALIGPPGKNPAALGNAAAKAGGLVDDVAEGTAKSGLLDDAGRVLGEGVENSLKKETTVLGHHPEYLDLADELGANRFSIPKNIWDNMTPDEQWLANQKFLDRMIRRGDDVRLATPLDQVRPGTYYHRELEYLFRNGYRIGSDGRTLIK